jgi:hypothetical protein
MTRFNLRIWITGLCCFYPDGPTMHVLLPATGRDAGGPNEKNTTKHKAEVRYNQKYEHGGQADQIRAIPLAGDLVLPTYSGYTFDPTLDHDILTISEIVDKAELKDGLIKPAPMESKLLTARLAFNAGALYRAYPGYFWNIGPIKNRQLSHHALWSIDNIEMEVPELVWGILPFGTSTPAPQAPLYPLDEGTGNTIELHVVHILPDEVPENQATIHHDPMLQRHFLAYYDLFDLPPGSREYFPHCHTKHGCAEAVEGRAIVPLIEPRLFAAGASTCALTGGK